MTKKTPGERIKEVRSAMGFSQMELAEKAGYEHPNSISYFETGKRPLSRKAAEKIAHALYCDPDYLLGLTEWPDYSNAFAPDYEASPETILLRLVSSIDNDVSYKFECEFVIDDDADMDDPNNYKTMIIPFDSVVGINLDSIILIANTEKDGKRPARVLNVIIESRSKHKTSKVPYYWFSYTLLRLMRNINNMLLNCEDSFSDFQAVYGEMVGFLPQMPTIRESYKILYDK